MFRAETALLERSGHDVYRYTVHNDAVNTMGQLKRAQVTLWNPDSFQKLTNLSNSWQPDIVHVHNTLPLISPAIYEAAQRAGAAVVQTLHNYRLFCPTATFYRDGQVCEACFKRHPLPAVRHKCYRDNRAASAAVAASLSFHRWRGSYDQVDAFIALNEFAQRKFVDGGLPAARVHLKPNFIDPDPGMGQTDKTAPYALFVGRLAPEKGITTLLKAWRTVPNLRLVIAGDGPLKGEVVNAASVDNITYAGRLSHRDVIKHMQAATLLVFPSTWYEGLPMTLLEAFACGAPVVASKLGSMDSLLEHGETGLHFKAGDAKSLTAQVNWAIQHPEALANIRRKARQTFETRFTAQVNYQQLLEVYASAIREHRSRRAQ